MINPAQYLIENGNEYPLLSWLKLPFQASVLAGSK
jgi:hypothetical protein